MAQPIPPVKPHAVTPTPTQRPVRRPQPAAQRPVAKPADTVQISAEAQKLAAKANSGKQQPK